MALVEFCADTLAPLYYRLAPWLALNLLDDPAMLALAFC